MGWRAFAGFHSTMWVVYASFLLIAWLGTTLQHRRTPVRIVGITLLGSVLFFLLTNFAYWLLFMPATIGGFMQTYAQAIPFFQYTLVGDLVYVGAMFGAMEWVQSRRLQLSRA